MLVHPVDKTKADILPSGAFIFTPVELAVIALAKSEKGRTPRPRGYVAQAFCKIDEVLTGRRANWTLANPRLEALRVFVNSLGPGGQGVTAATQTLQDAGFSSAQEMWLRSECAQPL